MTLKKKIKARENRRKNTMAVSRQKKRPGGQQSKSNSNSSLIVGIGASAGGLEAFKILFSNMPPDSGMTFVLVQHLSPDHKSMLADLLGKTTAMRVIEAENNTPVAANTVYVIPPDATLTLKEPVFWCPDRLRRANAAGRSIRSFHRWLKSRERTPSASFFPAPAATARLD